MTSEEPSLKLIWDNSHGDAYVPDEHPPEMLTRDEQTDLPEPFARLDEMDPSQLGLYAVKLVDFKKAMPGRASPATRAFRSLARHLEGPPHTAIIDGEPAINLATLEGLAAPRSDDPDSAQVRSFIGMKQGTLDAIRLVIAYKRSQDGGTPPEPPRAA